MRIAVFSDTHRNIDGAIAAVNQYRPDLIIHLGDHFMDAQKLKMEFPHIPMECVPGNCDYAPNEDVVKIIEPMGVRIMLTHGHTYRVKYETMPLLNAAFFQGANVVLYGHTHMPTYTLVQGMHIVNPGSAGQGRNRTWAKIEIEDGKVKDVRLMDI